MWSSTTSIWPWNLKTSVTSSVEERASRPRPSALASLAAPDFDLRLTLESGQVFHWQRVGQGYAGTMGDLPVYVEQEGSLLRVTPGAQARASRYFALDHPLPEVYASFPADDHMGAALAACRGLRIIRQPLWECLATFITSALKQVAHIGQISHLLRRRFGERVGTVEGLDLYAYPTAERLAALEEPDLRACGLGFRARTLLATARQLATGGAAGELEAIRLLEREAALKALRGFAGVGTKVANCVLLFGYERLDAFPIDVWIERVLRERYFRGKRKVTIRRLETFSQTYFGAYAGYAQQYLFHHARTGERPRRVRRVASARKPRRLKS
jgi:N-glycosylase/DNA lyase